ncbi:MAG: hypothetical protein J5855_07440 [Mailhella sp.]|nr:hypothetical protein [Mailhella sp.]
MDASTMAEKATQKYNESFSIIGGIETLNNLKEDLYDKLGLAAYGPVTINGEQMTFLRFRDRSWCCCSGWGQSPMKYMGVLSASLSEAEKVEKSLWDEDMHIDSIESAIAKAGGVIFHISTTVDNDEKPMNLEETRWYAFHDRSMLQVSITFRSNSGPEACAAALMPAL